MEGQRVMMKDIVSHEVILERLAMVDDLTELPNRRYLEATLTSRLSELQRHGWDFGVLFLAVSGQERWPERRRW